MTTKANSKIDGGIDPYKKDLLFLNGKSLIFAATTKAGKKTFAVPHMISRVSGRYLCAHYGYSFVCTNCLGYFWTFHLVATVLSLASRLGAENCTHSQQLQFVASFELACSGGKGKLSNDKNAPLLPTSTRPSLPKSCNLIEASLTRILIQR